MTIIVTDVIIAVRRALREQLLTVDGLPPTAAQQWEGMLDFTPPDDGSAWMRETMLRQPGAPMRASVGIQPRIRHTGGYQVSLFFPPDGPNDVNGVESVAGAIRAAFPFSLTLPLLATSELDPSPFMTCDGCGIGTIAPVTQFSRRYLHCPLRIAWWADTYNSI